MAKGSKLSQNEVVFQAKPALAAIVSHVVFTCMVFPLAKYFLKGYWNAWLNNILSGNLRPGEYSLEITVIVLCGLDMLITLARIVSTRLFVTDKKVFGKSGILITTDVDVPLEKIDNIVVKQSLFGKMLHFGTIRISNANSSYKVRFIKTPSMFRDTVMRMVEDKKKFFAQEKAKRTAGALAGISDKL